MHVFKACDILPTMPGAQELPFGYERVVDALVSHQGPHDANEEIVRTTTDLALERTSSWVTTGFVITRDGKLLWPTRNRLTNNPPDLTQFLGKLRGKGILYLTPDKYLGYGIKPPGIEEAESTAIVFMFAPGAARELRYSSSATGKTSKLEMPGNPSFVSDLDKLIKLPLRNNLAEHIHEAGIITEPGGGLASESALIRAILMRRADLYAYKKLNPDVEAISIHDPRIIRAGLIWTSRR